MRILQITISPAQKGTYKVRLTGKDDAGHILHASELADNQGAVESAIISATRRLSVLAAEVTEEETFPGSLTK